VRACPGGGRSIDAHQSVILYGPVGVGKTHVAQSLGHAACRRGFSVTFVKTHRVLAELASNRRCNEVAGRVGRLNHATADRSDPATTHQGIGKQAASVH
jgi:DNA replication protein DnaC